MLNNLKRGSRIPPIEPTASMGFLLQSYENIDIVDVKGNDILIQAKVENLRLESKRLVNILAQTPMNRRERRKLKRKK